MKVDARPPNPALFALSSLLDHLLPHRRARWREEARDFDLDSCVTAMEKKKTKQTRLLWGKKLPPTCKFFKKKTKKKPKNF